LLLAKFFKVNLGSLVGGAELTSHILLQKKDIVRKTLHTAHKGGSQEVSHVQKFNKQTGWLRKNGAAASLGRSGLK
jgi:hypothetical protein